MKNANLLSNEFNIKLVNEPESVSRVYMKRKVAKISWKWSQITFRKWSVVAEAD